MSKIKNAITTIFKWLWSKLNIRYKVTVSFNKEYGDSDDTIHIEYRSSGGLNYIIEEL